MSLAEHRKPVFPPGIFRQLRAPRKDRITPARAQNDAASSSIVVQQPPAHPRSRIFCLPGGDHRFAGAVITPLHLIVVALEALLAFPRPQTLRPPAFPSGKCQGVLPQTELL